MLEVRGFSIRAGNFLLEDIDLSIHEGGFSVIIGPTGSGKTLLLEGIAGIKGHGRGVIESRGRDISSIPSEKRGFSYVPQDIALFPHLNVEGNILYGIRIRGREPRRDYLKHLLEITGLTPLLGRDVSSLSGGEKQRVALVRALVVEPDLLLLDEPLSHVHPALRWELHDLLKGINRDLSVTTLMVTHDIEEAFSLGDTISVLIQGRILRTGRPREVYSSPRAMKVARFFGFRNLFHGRVTGLSGGFVHIESPDFGEIKAAGEGGVDAGEGEAVSFGIHSEEVTIVKPDRRFIPRVNTFKGRIEELFERGNVMVAIFSPQRGGRQIEITFPFYALRKLGIEKGVEAEIELNPEKIFLIEGKE